MLPQAPKGLESAMTAHGAARYSKKPPTGGLTGSVVGGLTGGLTASSLHLTHTHHALVLDDKTTMSGTLLPRKALLGSLGCGCPAL